MTHLPLGQWLTGSDGVRWFFDSGALCLDFCYTGDLGYGNPAWERLHAPGDLDGWLRDRFGRLSRSCSEDDHAAALRLRSAISTMARRATAGQDLLPDDVDLVNEWAARPAIPPHLPGGTHSRPDPSPTAAMAVIAHDAVNIFVLSGNRIRECAADDCRLIFVDTSRPGKRRWCSMQRCGNRAKSRAHYARQQR